MIEKSTIHLLIIQPRETRSERKMRNESKKMIQMLFQIESRFKIILRILTFRENLTHNMLNRNLTLEFHQWIKVKSLQRMTNTHQSSKLWNKWRKFTIGSQTLEEASLQTLFEWTMEEGIKTLLEWRKRTLVKTTKTHSSWLKDLGKSEWLLTTIKICISCRSDLQELGEIHDLIQIEVCQSLELEFKMDEMN